MARLEENTGGASYASVCYNLSNGSKAGESDVHDAGNDNLRLA